MSVESETLPRLFKALTFAAERHEQQHRRGAVASPYINHPIDVADILCREAAVTDLDVLCAALLHDTVEDTDATAEQLRSAFGEKVAAIVLELTDDESLPRAQRERQQEEHAACLSEPARLVKLADKISNLRHTARTPPPEWDLQRRREYFDWGKRVIDRLRGVNPRLEALFDQAYAARP
jgi:guanosine-3',5'-bis(diphosphate) 3'-pyrophosphohydrolase